MKNLKISTVALAVGLVFSISAVADTMSEGQYKAHDKSIDAEYTSAKAACDVLAGNANDICIAEAKGNKSIAKADLEANYKPTVKTRYEARVAKADAVYAVANEKCDDKAGNDKDVCVKEAKAAKISEIADAKAEMKTSKADAVANEKSADANATATEKTVAAHHDAAVDKRDADYKVAKEKCDVFAGDTKAKCVSDAKIRFGQT